MRTAPGGRVLIVNADDLGMSRGVNAGILAAHERGIVTSASLMVRRPAARHAADLLQQVPHLSVGLHVDLGEWVHRRGEWHVRHRVVEPGDRAAVAREVDAQLERFRLLTGRDPTHLDSHQHVHLREPARSVLWVRAGRLGIPVRGLSGEVVARGDFYGKDRRGSPCPEAISVDRLVQIISAIPVGTTELGCHPGYAEDLEDDYRQERRRELETLCDARVRRAVWDSGVCLRSHHPILVGQEAAWPLR